jgi:hypothetical protein
MGGLGSGGWNRTNRMMVDEVRRICVHGLLRDGVLSSPCSSTVNWERGGQLVSSIGIVGGRARIHLHYRLRGVGLSGSTHVAEDIDLDWRETRYGGMRPYLVCPGCKKRVWHLYLCGGRNLCRRCARLTYESRRSRRYDGLADTVHRLRLKLGGHPGFEMPIAPKPKGMHWNTYDGICSRIDALETASWEKARKKFEAIGHKRDDEDG